MKPGMLIILYERSLWKVCGRSDYFVYATFATQREAEYYLQQARNGSPR